MHTIARLLRPIMVRLFPDVPADHPAMGSMILNISANMLGLGNAATPFGIKAMCELQRLNPLPKTATNAMCLFLALNTSSVALLPLGVIGVRAAAGSTRPADIFLPTLIATCASTFVAIVVACFFANRDSSYRAETKDLEVTPENESSDAKEATSEDFSHLQTSNSVIAKALSYLSLTAFFGLAIYQASLAPDPLVFLKKDFVSFWLMPGLMLLIACYGLGRGVKVYEAVTEGAKQGFDIAIRIIPFLVAILVAIGMFRASGAMEALGSLLEDSWLTATLGMPVEAIPMALVRPLSGSGAFGIMSALIESDPDSYKAFVASTMMGSTETTFYVIAVYFGAVGVVRLRHALIAALCADLTGVIVSCIVSKMFWVA